MTPQQIKLFINEAYDDYFMEPKVISSAYGLKKLLLERLDSMPTQVKITVLNGEPAYKWKISKFANPVKSNFGGRVDGISRVTISSLPGMEVLEEEC